MPGSHVSGQDIVWLAVEVLRARLPHRHAWVGVTGSDLHVTQIDASIQLVVTNVWRSMCGCALAIWIPVPDSGCPRRQSRCVAASR